VSCLFFEAVHTFSKPVTTASNFLKLTNLRLSKLPFFLTRIGTYVLIVVKVNACYSWNN